MQLKAQGKLNWTKLDPCEVDIVPIDAAGWVFDLDRTNETQVNKIMNSLRSSKCRDAFQLDTMLI